MIKYNFIYFCVIYWQIFMYKSYGNIIKLKYKNSLKKLFYVKV